MDSIASKPNASKPKPSRAAISKKLRFEVFKRDSFRCQYCGAAAPDVLLEIDHVNPVANGGKGDILNLLTACQPCNAGKGKRRLGETTALSKQRDQLRELNERREQLEMMIRWKEELAALKDNSIERLSQFWSKLVPPFSLNEHGIQSLKKLAGRFRIDEIMDAMQIAADEYVIIKDGKPEQKSVETAWNKVSGICRTRQIEKSKPYIRDMYYVRGILRNRVYVNENYVMDLLENAFLAGVDPESLKRLAKTCSSWTRFREEVESFTARG
jgi:hypothetical protein